MKFLIKLSLLTALLLPNTALGDEIKEYCQSLVGQNFFLKIEVVKIFEGLKNTDATNIYPTGEVIHRKSFTVTPDARVFASEIGRQALAKGRDWYISLLERGTQILVHRVEIKKTEVQIEFTQQSGRQKKDHLELPQQTVRLKFDKKFTVEDVKESFARGFGQSRYEAVIELRKGMTEDEIVDRTGIPNRRLILDTKTILYFDDMKLILIDGELADGM